MRRKEGMKSRLDTGRLCAVLLICLSELGGVWAEQLEGKCRPWSHNPGLKTQFFSTTKLGVCPFRHFVGWSVCACVCGGGEGAAEVCQLQEAHEIDFQRMPLRITPETSVLLCEVLCFI